nr:hypothetical protein GCM10020092_068800 [Actinoplanes digitatis]
MAKRTVFGDLLDEAGPAGEAAAAQVDPPQADVLLAGVEHARLVVDDHALDLGEFARLGAGRPGPAVREPEPRGQVERVGAAVGDPASLAAQLEDAQPGGVAGG